MATNNSNDSNPVSMAQAFEHANASLALEGLVVDDAQRQRQQRVIDGHVSVDQAIAEAIDFFKEKE